MRREYGPVLPQSSSRTPQAAIGTREYAVPIILHFLPALDILQGEGPPSLLRVCALPSTSESFFWWGLSTMLNYCVGNHFSQLRGWGRRTIWISTASIQLSISRLFGIWAFWITLGTIPDFQTLFTYPAFKCFFFHLRFFFFFIINSSFTFFIKVFCLGKLIITVIMIIVIELRGNLLFLSNSTSFVLSLAPYRLLYAFHFLSLGQKEEQHSHLFLSLQSSSDQKCKINLRQILFWRPAGQLPSILKSHVSRLKQSYLKFAFAQSSIWNVTFPPSLWSTTAQYST